MTDLFANLRARQAAINTEIAGHMAAVSALVAELSDIATTGRVFATIAAAKESTAPASLSAVTPPVQAKRVAQASSEPEDAGGVHDRCESTPPTNSAASTQEHPRPMDSGEVSTDLAASNIAPVAMGEADAVDLTASADLSQIGDDGSLAEPDAADERAGEVGPETVGASPAQSAPGKTAEPSGSAAPSLRSRIAMLHREHPEFTRDEAMAALDCTRGSLTGYSSILGIKWASLPRSGGRPPKKLVEADPSPEPQEPAPEPEPSPASTPAPANDMPRAVRPRSGSKFYLVNEGGEYLNRYCAGFTNDRREAWVGSEQQLAGCRRNFTIARDLTEKPVTKDQPVNINREVA